MAEVILAMLPPQKQHALPSKSDHLKRLTWTEEEGEPQDLPVYLLSTQGVSTHSMPGDSVVPRTVLKMTSGPCLSRSFRSIVKKEKSMEARQGKEKNKCPTENKKGRCEGGLGVTGQEGLKGLAVVTRMKGRSWACTILGEARLRAGSPYTET